MKNLLKTSLLTATAVTAIKVATRLRIVNTGIYQPYEIKAKYGAPEVDSRVVRKIYFFE